MRRKKHGAERIAACAHLLIEDPTALMSDPNAPFGTARLSLLRSVAARVLSPAELRRLTRI